jgi:putative membrane protein
MKILPFVLALAFASAVEAAPALGDAEIAHIAYTAGQLDIDAARLALEKTSDPQVKAFAQTMLRDHAAVNQRALALVGKLGVTPADNDVSRGLATAAAAALEKQRALRGHAFDRAYVANEVAYHAQVNTALHDTLIPGAKNTELRGLLEDGLALFREHQHHAERLAKAQP